MNPDHDGEVGIGGGIGGPDIEEEAVFTELGGAEGAFGLGASGAKLIGGEGLGPGGMRGGRAEAEGACGRGGVGDAFEGGDAVRSGANDVAGGGGDGVGGAFGGEGEEGSEVCEVVKVCGHGKSVYHGRGGRARGKGYREEAAGRSTGPAKAEEDPQTPSAETPEVK